ncbi:MAG: ribose transport system ATP-binding protein [Pseudonocardiales bacterium]|nr:ribose transport system ATP-binding protein [Pseudonocardiales bacterium]
MTPLLSVEHLVKSFHGNRAVDDVTFEVGRGEIVALLGENGAGKSTVIKMLAGVHRPDSGTIEVDGARSRHGIAFVHQDLGLVEWMTAAENIAMAAGFPRRGGVVSWSRVREQAVRALDLVGGGIDPDARVFDLPRAERSLLAIARCLTGEPKLVVLDEPTASLPLPDVARLFTVLRGLRDRGVGMIYVSHRLDEVYEIADSVVVLRDGEVVGRGATDDVPPGELVRLIVGRSAATTPPGEAGTVVRLELHGAEVGDVGPVELTLRAGEVVGLVGLRGAGQEEIGRAVAGVLPLRAGRMSLEGEDFRPRDTASAVAAGIGFSTSNREAEGLANGLSVRENMFLNPAVRDSWSRGRAERGHAAKLVREFGVRPAGTEIAVDALSGGNQQKVMLARWWSTGRAVVVLEEPTMGVDVGAKADIHALLRKAAERGVATLVVSTDLEEVAAVCHRALVFERGRVRCELAGNRLTTGALAAAASGLPDEGV